MGHLGRKDNARTQICVASESFQKRMTLNVPDLYHWSPEKYRRSIVRSGLRPTSLTAVYERPVKPGERLGHWVEDLSEESLLAVCFGTSPSTAWAYSGALSSERGETWDLWQIELKPQDEVHFRSAWGNKLDEVRIANPIPRGRCWFVGSRTCPERGSRWYANPNQSRNVPRETR